MCPFVINVTNRILYRRGGDTNEGDGNMSGNTQPAKNANLLPVFALTLSAFIFNCSENMPIGLLSNIADSFGITSAAAGSMITIYATAVLILSIPLMVAASRVPPRKLIVAVVCLFGVGQVCTALSPTFPLLVASRLIVACSHCIFWSVAAPFAVRTVDEEHASAAIGMVAAGQCVASVIGIPIGRTIGTMFGWRVTFAVIACLTIAGIAMLFLVFPKLDTGEKFSMAQLPVLAKNKTVLGAYVLVALLVMGYYTAYSYVEPFFTQVAGLSAGTITILLAIFGLAGIFGSHLFTQIYEKTRSHFLICSAAGMALALALVVPLSGSVVGAFVLCIFWGTVAVTFNVACQNEIIRGAGQSCSSVAMAIFVAVYNLGISGGSFIGGRVFNGLGIGYIGFVGAIIAALGLAWCVVKLGPQLRASE